MHHGQIQQIRSYFYPEGIVFFIYGHQKGRLAKFQQEETEKSKRHSELKVLKNDLSDLQNYYLRLHNLSLRYKGTLASFESPGETFDYIRRELATTNSGIILNMDFKKEEPFKSGIKRNYELRGIGKFINIYNLLWFLENGPVFYSIEKLTINKIDESEMEKIRASENEAAFNFTMFGYDRKEGPKITEINRDFGTPKKVADLFNYNTIFNNKKSKRHFASQVSKKSTGQITQEPKQLVNSRGLPEINTNCEVLAITPFSVMVKDANGKIVKLRKGDEIFGGNLAQLNTQEGQAIFQFNGGFGNKSVVLTLKN